MARPLSVTDEQIFEASERMVERFGLHGLSISNVAREVGLSRAAISLRFGNGEDLRRVLLEKQARSFEDMLAGVDLPRGAAGLLGVAEMLGGMLKGRDRLSSFWFRYMTNIHEPAMLEMENRRGAALRGLIARVMPDTRLSSADAVDQFMATMTGSIVNWQTGDDVDAAHFLRERALGWSRLAGIDS